VTRPTCACGHPADFHVHYRNGDDCGTCDCRAYQQPRVPLFERLRLLLRRTRLA
jgi:hypothetical protein